MFKSLVDLLSFGYFYDKTSACIYICLYLICHHNVAFLPLSGWGVTIMVSERQVLGPFELRLLTCEDWVDTRFSFRLFLSYSYCLSFANCLVSF